MYNLVALNTFTVLHNHNHIYTHNFFIIPNETSVPIK